MVISINFKGLMTIFNVIITCPVRASDLVAEALTTSGAAKTQQGFIVDTNRKTEQEQKVLSELNYDAIIERDSSDESFLNSSLLLIKGRPHRS